MKFSSSFYSLVFLVLFDYTPDNIDSPGEKFVEGNVYLLDRLNQFPIHDLFQLNVIHFVIYDYYTCMAKKRINLEINSIVTSLGKEFAFIIVIKSLSISFSICFHPIFASLFVHRSISQVLRMTLDNHYDVSY